MLSGSEEWGNQAHIWSLCSPPVKCLIPSDSRSTRCICRCLTVILDVGRWKQTDWEFKANLCCIASSRQARVIWDPVSNNNKRLPFLGHSQVCPSAEFAEDGKTRMSSSVWCLPLVTWIATCPIWLHDSWVWTVHWKCKHAASQKPAW